MWSHLEGNSICSSPESLEQGLWAMVHTWGQQMLFLLRQTYSRRKCERSEISLGGDAFICPNSFYRISRADWPGICFSGRGTSEPQAKTSLCNVWVDSHMVLKPWSPGIRWGLGKGRKKMFVLSRGWHNCGGRCRASHERPSWDSITPGSFPTRQKELLSHPK